MGASLEVLFEDGWWEVSLKKIKKASGTTPASYLVLTPAYLTERWADEASLRPLWNFTANGLAGDFRGECRCHTEAACDAQHADHQSLLFAIDHDCSPVRGSGGGARFSLTWTS